METQDKTRIDLGALQAKLAGKRGKQYWRSLEEIAETPEFEAWVEDEFPNRHTILQMDRRQLLKYMGASMALAGLSGCRSYFLGTEKVVPYVRQPEEMVTGKPLFYASSFAHNGYGTGVLVEQNEGRPTKIEGNPDHPASSGTSDVWMQASILSMYDPDRATTVLQSGQISTWTAFNREFRAIMEKAKANGGAGIRVLADASGSPTFKRVMAEFEKAYPMAVTHVWSPVSRDNVHKGAELSTSKPMEPIYDFKGAKVVVSLDSDFLNVMPGHLKYAKEFADGRRVLGSNTEMNRLYSVQTTPSLAGAMADHCWTLKPSAVEPFAFALAAALGIGPGADSAFSEQIGAIAKDIQANKGSVVVVPGDQLPPAVHALCNAINATFGKAQFVEPVVYGSGDVLGALQQLTEALNAGKVETLIVLGANPIYSAPGDLKFADAFEKAKVKIVHSAYVDETGVKADWHLPATHYLEAWGDTTAFDGSVSLIQPIIQPLFDGKSDIELVASMFGSPKDGLALVKETHGLGEKAWREALHKGLVSAGKPATIAQVSASGAVASTKKSEGLEIIFREDPHVFDGRYSNNGWLQELPKPLTKTVWENLAFVSVGTAKRLNLNTEDVIEIQYGGVPTNAGVFVQPGHPEDAITVHFGYGRTQGGTVATATELQGGGFNAFAMRQSNALWFDSMPEPRKVSSGGHMVSTTQVHNQIDDDRDVIRTGTIADYLKNPSLREESHHGGTPESKSLYPDNIFDFEGPQWGMTIDMNVCTGCNVCAIACQAENNISVVGKEQVRNGREMHWIRIDRYYTGDIATPEEVVFQPVACVHCEKAPCEPVCPVAATVHSHEGLNQMVYNRCVGTRYCSNNCPYKVRRFNYKNWSDNQIQFMKPVPAIKALGGNTTEQKTDGIQLLRMLNNPDVTVRGRGVMEKCTYCVQRISNVRIEAKKAGREPQEGEIVTACQQACPTQAIVFGNVADPESQVSKMRNDPRSYQLLRELQTRPRTSHMGRLRNPNPELVKA
jgi:molybdopterin-containing oxidoreductase family iron-sulfur binding subunit